MATSPPPGGTPPQPRPTIQTVVRRGTPLVLREKPYNPKHAREKTRSYLAGALVGALILATLSLIGLVAGNLISADEAKDLAVVAVSPLVAITSAAVGFYFGGQKHNGDD